MGRNERPAWLIVLFPKRLLCSSTGQFLTVSDRLEEFCLKIEAKFGLGRRDALTPKIVRQFLATAVFD